VDKMQKYVEQKLEDISIFSLHLEGHPFSRIISG